MLDGMGAIIKLTVLAGVLGAYMFYLSSMQNTINSQLNSISSIYSHAEQLATENPNTNR